MDMNIQKYMAFVKTIETGSFTKAADALSYSQSGISRMINDLEREWRVVLLKRGKSGIRLTSEGEQLLPFAKKVCEEYYNLQMEVDSINGLDAGMIRIGVFSSVATHWMPWIIKEFRRDYPNIDYELLMGDYAEIEQWIVEGRVDCGFLMLPVKSELECISLERDPLMAVIPEDHPLAHAERFPIDAFSREPFLLLERSAKAEATALFEENGIKPDVHFITWDDYAIMSMVENGLGISILSNLILTRNPYRIVTKELDVPAYRDIGFAVRSEKKASLAVRRFMEYLHYRKEA